MCAVSNMGDMGRTMWPKPFEPNTLPGIYPGQAPFHPLAPKPWNPMPSQIFAPQYNGPTKEQFEEFLKLLRAAKRFDTLLGMKDCEMAEKLEWLKAIAVHLGVDVKDLAP